MNAIERHKEAIRILRAIETFSSRINTELANKNQLFYDQSKSRHNVNIYNRCIERLENRYHKLTNKL